MGIQRFTANILLREHRFRPIEGQLLLIGRQAVRMTPRQAYDLVTQELGRALRQPESLDLDTLTRSGQGKESVTDRAFFSLFSCADVHCLDISSYEGADIILNLSQTLPDDLLGRFDFIYEGSCLDNIFDAAAAQRNLSRLLRPGGRIFQVECSARVNHAYTAFALSWFHDYFAVNEYEDCQVYLAQHHETGYVDLYHYNPTITRNGHPSYFGQDRTYDWSKRAHCVVIAEKGLHSTSDRSPVQYQYRSGTPISERSGKREIGWLDGPASAEDVYFQSSVRFMQSVRAPNLSNFEKHQRRETQSYDEQISYCGSIENPLK